MFCFFCLVRIRLCSVLFHWEDFLPIPVRGYFTGFNWAGWTGIIHQIERWKINKLKLFRVPFFCRLLHYCHEKWAVPDPKWPWQIWMTSRDLFVSPYARSVVKIPEWTVQNGKFNKALYRLQRSTPAKNQFTAVQKPVNNLVLKDRWFTCESVRTNGKRLIRGRLRKNIRTEIHRKDSCTIEIISESEGISIWY